MRNVRRGACALEVVAARAMWAVGWGRPAAAPPSLNGVNFISVCGFSHRAPDDPIVLPRQPGLSHECGTGS